MVLPMATIYTLIAIEAAGLVITIGFGVAAYKAYKKSLQMVDDAKVKARKIIEAAEKILGEFKTSLS